MTKLVERDDCSPIKNVHDLFEAVVHFREQGTRGDVYLRGHACTGWNLVPTIGRKNFYRYGPSVIEKFSQDQEYKLLHRFRRYAYAHVGRTLNPWEALFLARQHGLPVRLLDWTSNPLIALFNAVEDAEHFREDGAVWLLRKRLTEKDKDIDVLDKHVDPLKVRGVRMVYPSYVSQRLVVQSGFFTIHDYPWTDLADSDPKGHDQAEFDVERLKKLKVPCGRKKDLLEHLMRAAISSRTLFPDLDGLAKGLWQLEAIRH